MCFVCTMKGTRVSVVQINELVEAGGGAAVAHVRIAIHELRSW